MAIITPRMGTTPIQIPRQQTGAFGVYQPQVYGFDAVLNALRQSALSISQNNTQNGSEGQANSQSSTTTPDLQDPAYLLLNRGGSLKQHLASQAVAQPNQINGTSINPYALLTGGNPNLINNGLINPLNGSGSLNNTLINPLNGNTAITGNNLTPISGTIISRPLNDLLFSQQFPNNITAPVPWGGDMYTTQQNNPYGYAAQNWPQWPVYNAMQASPLVAGNLMTLPQLRLQMPTQWNNYALAPQGGYWA
jgi:hypothetical protein